MAVVYDGYFKGVHYVEKSHLLDSNNTVTLYAKDFSKMTDYILKLEYKLYLATGEKSAPIKDY